MSDRSRSDVDAIRMLDRVPAKLLRALRSLNALVLPPERFRGSLQMGLSVFEETYFIAKNLIDGTIHVSEKVLYDEDYHGRRLEAYRGQRRLVVFVPGYMQLASGFQRLERYLGIDVFDAFTYVYGDFPYSQHIELSAHGLATRLRAIQQALAVDEIFLVGHSQGGIIIRTLVQHGLAPELPIRKCLFLSSPHQGTWVGLAGLPHRGLRKAFGLLPYARQVRGESGLQLVPGSAFLTQLNARPLPEHIRFASVHYNFDPMILPPENAVLPYAGAHNHFINKVGHAQPLYCSRAIEIAIRFLYGSERDAAEVEPVREHRPRPSRRRAQRRSRAGAADRRSNKNPSV